MPPNTQADEVLSVYGKLRAAFNKLNNRKKPAPPPPPKNNTLGAADKY